MVFENKEIDDNQIDIIDANNNDTQSFNSCLIDDMKIEEDDWIIDHIKRFGKKPNLFDGA